MNTTRNSMTPHYEAGPVRIFHGDCIDVMRGLADNSVDAVVTDPPYGLEFMGKEWDSFGGSVSKVSDTATVGRQSSTPFAGGGQRVRYGAPGAAFGDWCYEWAAECFRVLKPGGHILAFGGSRTWHRLAAAIEDAGFEIRDSIAWLYGSGFPKSMGVSKAIDKVAGAERETKPWIERDRTGVFAGDSAETTATRGNLQCPDCLKWKFAVDYCKCPRDNGAQTDAAKAWEGWGTALKPAFEPIVVGRKPLQGTVAGNVLAYGVGALNIDATRVEGRERTNYGPSKSTRSQGATYGAPSASADFDSSKGRWPANVVLDETQAAELDRQSGITSSRSGGSSGASVLGVLNDDGWQPRQVPRGGQDDSGGASRFFPTFRYEAKAPGSERPTADGVSHPTVKPLDLMRWLVRLVTPPGGVVLEPFAGSGTTVEACIREGFGCIAIEREADYLPLILKRVRKDHEQSLFGDDWDAA